MKKINLIDAVIDFLSSDAAGDSKGIYHPEIVKVHLNNVFNSVVYNTWLNGKKFSDFSQLDAWSRTYECTIVTQTHALLPFAPIQLPDNMGIRQVCDHADNTNVFAYMEATGNVVFAELDVNTMDSTPTFRLEQNNLSVGAGEPSHMLRLEKLPTPLGIITSVDVMLIVPMDQVDDYDDISMPQELGDNIVRQVIDLMSKKQSPDILNDQVNQK
jgi:hypothetical protein